MKKAFKWLMDKNTPYEFHDYKKQGVPTDIIADAIITHGWENVINKRGTTWRKLNDTTKENINNETAVTLAINNPSIVKRPLLIHNGVSVLGFKADDYKNLF